MMHGPLKNPIICRARTKPALLPQILASTAEKRLLLQTTRSLLPFYWDLPAAHSSAPLFSSFFSFFFYCEQSSEPPFFFNKRLLVHVATSHPHLRCCSGYSYRTGRHSRRATRGLAPTHPRLHPVRRSIFQIESVKDLQALIISFTDLPVQSSKARGAIDPSGPRTENA